jgi:hypothetical protein
MEGLCAQNKWSNYKWREVQVLLIETALIKEDNIRGSKYQ